MKNKYFNDAILGNGNILVSFSQKGELLRFFYPNVDYAQHIDEFNVGFTSDDSCTVWLHEDINNLYNQYFEENTNILNTEIFNSYFKIFINQKDYVCIDKNILVKKYTVENRSNKPQNIKILVYSKLLRDLNNYTSGYFKNNTLIQYNHDYCFGILSKTKCLSYQINGAKDSKSVGQVFGKDYIGMSNDSSIMYDLGEISPNETKEFVLYLTITSNVQDILNIKIDDEEKMYLSTKKYWNNFVDEHKNLKVQNSKINEIYTRTILLFPLLANKETGGISAGVEIDENMTKCGRYSYCWLRDSAFINSALDICKMEDAVEYFYNNFAKLTQQEDGFWEQRYYTDGTLAPCWGYQIDETASLIYGVWSHFEKTRDIQFLIKNLEMLEKAVKYLEYYLKNRNTIQKSYDLWEEREGTHTYSLAAISASFKCMAKIYKKIDACSIEENKNNKIRIEQLEKLSIDTANTIFELFYTDGYFKRNNLDDVIDISVLGLCIPFKIFKANDERIKNTVAIIESRLKNKFGGITRYENDGYSSNMNAWPIATLWLSLYYIELGEIDKAKEYFNFVVETAGKHGYLAEQIDGNTNKPIWVFGLAWSHAMFILVLEKLYNYYLFNN